MALSAGFFSDENLKMMAMWPEYFVDMFEENNWEPPWSVKTVAKAAAVVALTGLAKFEAAVVPKTVVHNTFVTR